MTRSTMSSLASAALLCAIVFLAGVHTSTAQPFKFTPEPFAPQESELASRQSINYEGLVFDFATARKTEGGTPNGDLRSNQITQNPFLSTLPGQGNGQTLVSMGPCAGNTPHTHPRGSEISFLTTGTLDFGIIEENGTPTAPGNKLRMVRLQQGQTIHVPTGLMHFSHNPTCQPAQFLANFGERDPGTQTVWASLMQVPNAILNAATGIPESTFQQFKTYPLVIAPGTGGDQCLAKCGLKFSTANAFTPSAASEAPASETPEAEGLLGRR